LAIFPSFPLTHSYSVARRGQDSNPSRTFSRRSGHFANVPPPLSRKRTSANWVSQTFLARAGRGRQRDDERLSPAGSSPTASSPLPDSLQFSIADDFGRRKRHSREERVRGSGRERGIPRERGRTTRALSPSRPPWPQAKKERSFRRKREGEGGKRRVRV